MAPQLLCHWITAGQVNFFWQRARWVRSIHCSIRCCCCLISRLGELVVVACVAEHQSFYRLPCFLGFIAVPMARGAATWCGFVDQAQLAGHCQFACPTASQKLQLRCMFPRHTASTAHSSPCSKPQTHLHGVHCHLCHPPYRNLQASTCCGCNSTSLVLAASAQTPATHHREQKTGASLSLPAHLGAVHQAGVPSV